MTTWKPLTQWEKGAFRSVVKRIVEMDPLAGKVVATGGVVAHNPTIVELLAEAIGSPVHTPPEPQLTGALGAALFARDHATGRAPAAVAKVDRAKIDR